MRLLKILLFIILETLVHDLEFSQVQTQVLDGLKVGNAALEKANKMFSIEEIEQIMSDTAEGVEKVKIKLKCCRHWFSKKHASIIN